MVVNALLRGLIVEGNHNQHRVDARVRGALGQRDGLLGGGAARARDDGLAAGHRLDGRFEQLRALLKRQKRCLAGGAGHDERVAQVLFNQILNQLSIAVIVHFFVCLVGRHQRQKDASEFFLFCHGNSASQA
ncbi:hypothetical protein SDC9_182636 [bioreactor metagenome]|uniref:Uncharacterized protein n=1 Tax=bioreactor metagenome TaxID=1076179 RepID=A0A645H7Y8_9ZZZZ